MTKKITYYKAVRTDGTDFRTGTIDYLSDRVIRCPHNGKKVRDDPSTYLSISTEPAETLIGGSWPCRLLEVKPFHNLLSGLQASPYKRAATALMVIRELPAHQALGPNGEAVVALIERAKNLTTEEISRLDATREAAWEATRDAARYATREAAWKATRKATREAAWDAAWKAARYAAWDVAWDAAWDAAWEAASALVVRDLITEEHFQILSQPWLDGISD